MSTNTQAQNQAQNQGQNQGQNQAHERAVTKNEHKARAAAERQAELDAIRARTARLQALRLAQQARIQQHVRRASKAAGRPAKGPEKKLTLADWIAQQRASGRET